MGRPKYSKQDRELGMNRRISRRDFLNGVAIASGAAALSQLPPGLAQGADPTT